MIGRLLCRVGLHKWIHCGTYPWGPEHPIFKVCRCARCHGVYEWRLQESRIAGPID